jgi:hypothetical protein
VFVHKEGKKEKKKRVLDMKQPRYKAVRGKPANEAMARAN